MVIGMTRMRNLISAVVLALSFNGNALADDLNLVIQPIYDPQRASEVYRPLVDYLNRATSHNITLVTPKNFHQFWIDMRRRDDWHLVFDGPHLTDYRIQKLGYTPLVKTAEPTSFSLLAGYNITEESLRGLVAHRVVTMPAPSMGYTVLTSWYTNPLQQPIIVSSAISWRDTVEIVFADEADAAVVPTWLANHYPNLIPIEQSADMPGAAISASAQVSDAARTEITNALLTLHEDEALFEVLSELNISQFEGASASDYAGFAEMLQDFFGY